MDVSLVRSDFDMHHLTGTMSVSRVRCFLVEGLTLKVGSTDIPPTYSPAICSNHKWAKAKAKANYDQWPLAGYPARKAGGAVMIPGGIMVS